MTQTAAPAVRLADPGEIIAALPHLCGFPPTDSVVLLALRPPRARVALAIRLDLPAAGQEREAAELLVARLMTVGPTASIVVICTDDPAHRPHPALVEALRRACRDAGAPVRDALLSRGGRWWSYDCEAPSCCPPEGTPVPGADSSRRLGLLAAEGVLAGRQVLPDRDALVEALAPPLGGPAEQAAEAQRCAAKAWAGQLRRRGAVVSTSQALAAWTAALAAYQQRGDAFRDDVRSVARLVVTLQHLPVRDRLLTRAADQPEVLLAVLQQLARRTLPPHDAAVCTLLAVTAWATGDGALANVALDRALVSDPGYRLAVLVRAGLDHAVPPDQVRRWLRLCKGL